MTKLSICPVHENRMKKKTEMTWTIKFISKVYPVILRIHERFPAFEPKVPANLYKQ